MADYSAEFRVSSAGSSAVDRPPNSSSSTLCPSGAPPPVTVSTEALIVVGRPRAQPSTTISTTSSSVDKFPKQIQDAVSKVPRMLDIYFTFFVNV